jgi:hypothetical protein
MISLGTTEEDRGRTSVRPPLGHDEARNLRQRFGNPDHSSKAELITLQDGDVGGNRALRSGNGGPGDDETLQLYGPDLGASWSGT